MVSRTRLQQFVATPIDSICFLCSFSKVILEQMAGMVVFRL